MQQMQNFTPPAATSSLPSNIPVGRNTTINPGTGASPEAFPRGTGFGVNVQRTFK
jgi:hypothetical protein